MNNSRLGFVILVQMLAMPLSAQVEITGSLDVGFRAGGDRSGHFVNGIDENFANLHLRFEELNLNFFTPISDQFYIEARLRTKNGVSGKLDPPKLDLASINYSPEGKKYFLSAGKIILPFGFYPVRQLQIDRTFVDFPIAYSYSINMSRTRGWFKGIKGRNDNAALNYNDYGVQTIFYGGYTAGLLYGWQNDDTEIKAAFTNEPATGYEFSNLATKAGMLRVRHNFNINLTVGFSATHGSFMHADDAYESLYEETDFTKFTQTAFSTDFQVEFTYFEIIAEGTYSNWKVPYYDLNYGFFGSQSGGVEKFNLQNYATNIDLRYEPPFFTGGYLALRLEKLFFPAVKANNTLNGERWDTNIAKYTAVIGYKFDRNVLLKVSYSDQNDFDRQYYAFKAYLTAAF